MATEVKLPALGESVTEGTVTQWLKAVGDTVAVDEPLLEVSTDKVDTEIPSPVAGTLLEIRAAEDETVEVGAVLAVVGDEGEGAGGSGQSEQPAPSAQPEPSEQPPNEAGPVADEHEQEPPRESPPEETQETPREQPQEQPAAAQAGDSGGSAGSGGGDGTPVTLPALGESVTEGTVTQWLKAVGDTVAVDEPLLEVSTDKVDTEIPSPVAGTLLEIRAAEDETVEVGAVLAVVGSGSPSTAAAAEQVEPPRPAQQPEAEQADAQQPQAQAQAQQAEAQAPQAEQPQAHQPQAQRAEPEQPAAAEPAPPAAQEPPEPTVQAT